MVGSSRGCAPPGAARSVAAAHEGDGNDGRAGGEARHPRLAARSGAGVRDKEAVGRGLPRRAWGRVCGGDQGHQDHGRPGSQQGARRDGRQGPFHKGTGRAAAERGGRHLRALDEGRADVARAGHDPALQSAARGHARRLDLAERCAAERSRGRLRGGHRVTTSSGAAPRKVRPARSRPPPLPAPPGASTPTSLAPSPLPPSLPRPSRPPIPSRTQIPALLPRLGAGIPRSSA